MGGDRAEPEEEDMTHEQAELFERFAGIWAEIYRQYHNLSSVTDIPIDIAVAVAQMMREDAKRCGLDEPEKQEYNAEFLRRWGHDA